MASEVKIFSGSATRYLAEEIAGCFHRPLGKITTTRFADGEMETSFDESVRGDTVFIVQSTFGPAENVMELLLMIDAARRASADKIVVVMPYYGYARQDRKDKPRVSIGAKLVANMLTAAGADRIVTMDLHAGQIQGFFDIPLDHLYGTGVFFPYLTSLGLDNIAVAAPDAGGAKRAREYATFLKSDLILIDKFRERANEVASMKVIGDVKGKNVLIVDDIVDTAGTLSQAANHLVFEGAASVRAVVTHPVLSGPAYDRIQNSSMTELITTNTIPLKDGQPREKIKVLSIAPMLSDAFHKIYNFESISSLYI
ncbi:MAG: ribose-phosphate pyrophosphokinase [Bacteroidota bacterium]